MGTNKIKDFISDEEMNSFDGTPEFISDDEQ